MATVAEEEATDGSHAVDAANPAWYQQLVLLRAPIRSQVAWRLTQQEFSSSLGLAWLFSRQQLLSQSNESRLM